MSSKKTIVIQPSLLRGTKRKKKAVDVLEKIPAPVTEKPSVKPEPQFGCLKHGKKPTFHDRRTRVVTVEKFGRTNNKTVSVRTNDIKTIKQIDKEKQKLSTVTLSDILQYTTAHNLTRVGTTAPEHVIRTIYEASRLTGDVMNDNSGNLLHNYNHAA